MLYFPFKIHSFIEEGISDILQKMKQSLNQATNQAKLFLFIVLFMNRDSLYEYEPYHPYLNLSKYNLSADSIKNIVFYVIVREMMYGFGDNVQTIPQTVNLMEAIAKDYLQTIVLK